MKEEKNDVNNEKNNKQGRGGEVKGRRREGGVAGEEREGKRTTKKSI